MKGNYAKIADRFGVILCERAFGSCAHLNHKAGAATPHPIAVVHWHRKIVTRPGLRHFLMLCAQARFTRCRQGPVWLRIYNQNITACEFARVLKVRLDQRHLSVVDRARVRAMVTALDPRALPAEDRAVLPRVRHWSRRFPLVWRHIDATHSVLMVRP